MDECTTTCCLQPLLGQHLKRPAPCYVCCILSSAATGHHLHANPLHGRTHCLAGRPEQCWVCTRQLSACVSTPVPSPLPQRNQPAAGVWHVCGAILLGTYCSSTVVILPCPYAAGKHLTTVWLGAAFGAGHTLIAIGNETLKFLGCLGLCWPTGSCLAQRSLQQFLTCSVDCLAADSWVDPGVSLSISMPGVCCTAVIF